MSKNLVSRSRRACAVVSCLAAMLAVPTQALAAAPEYVRTVGRPAVAAMYPSGLEYDAARNRIVVADTGMNHIQLRGLDGSLIKRFGSRGAARGQLDAPRDVAVDGASNIYVADADNNRVQKFDADGGFKWELRGVPHPMGVTWDERNGKLLVAGTGGNVVWQVRQNGVVDWKSPRSLGAEFGQVRDAARGPDGRLWITDYSNGQIDVFDVSTDGQRWTRRFSIGKKTAGGAGPAGLGFPYNVDFSPDGKTVYVADTGGSEIERWDRSVTPPRWIDGPFGNPCPGRPEPCPDPPADKGLFDNLRRVAVTETGDIIGADFWGNGLQVFSPAGRVVQQIAGFAPPDGGFAQAYGVGVAGDGTTYVMDRLNQQVDRYRADGAYLNSAGSRGVAEGAFSWPEEVAVAPNGMVWVADTRNDQLVRWKPDLTGPVSVPDGASKGSALGQFYEPSGLDVDGAGRVWVADTYNNRVQVYDPAAATSQRFRAVGAGKLFRPQGVAAGNTLSYVADTENNRVQQYSMSGTLLGSSSGVAALKRPEGLTVADDGTVWVADTYNNRVVHLSANLRTDLRDDIRGTGGAALLEPHTVEAVGRQLFVTDTHNHRVRVYRQP